MRYAALVTLVLLMFAAPLSAAWYPRFSSTDLQMYVGQRERITVIAMFSGLVIYPGDTGPHWTFASDNPAVATGSVNVDGTAQQTFDVVAVSPGEAHIRQDGFSYVTIHVSCPKSAVAAVAVNPVVHAEFGNDVHLTVVTEFDDARFRWYRGMIGDTSHPLGRSSWDAVYTPDAYGTQYIWVEVTTGCATSHLQFRVDVYGRQRQRAARH